jgi:hypothetical protein
MKKALRYLCLLLVLAAAGAGQFASLEFWPVLLSFSFHYHPDVAWVLGWLIVFAVVPAIVLALSIAALASEAWKRRSKKSVRWLSAVSAASAIWMLFATGGEAPLIWWVIVAPFGVIQIGAALVLTALLEEKRANQSPQTTLGSCAPLRV